MSKKGEGSLSWLRDRNRRRVLDVLRISGRTSQADIARATGLSRTTIHTLIGELKDEGMVLEVDGRPAGAGSGRPAVQLVLQKTSRAVLGIDFGHSHVQVAVADLAHNVLAERHRDLDVNHRRQGGAGLLGGDGRGGAGRGGHRSVARDRRRHRHSRSSRP